ncbi:MAG: DUF4416 family protein [Candidatus Sumerlaeota bacterium]|nr:DUF4416 family protein [Candidatus Sumerlaeota bacterium]
MSVPHKPDPVKLFFAILAAPDAPAGDLERRIAKEFSAIDHRLAEFDFTMSDYYEGEMGERLRKRIVACERLIDPSDLVDIKLHTIRVERHYARPGGGGRLLNIDPGWLDPSRVVLATGKDYAHRVYVGHGIYEEVTLIYRRRPPGFESLPWTYPDYRKMDVLKFFNEAREICLEQRRALKAKD